ncbi:hypothetical protein AgCh_034559 [Apium graveolens]
MGCFTWSTDLTKRFKDKKKYKALDQNYDDHHTTLDSSEVFPVRIDKKEDTGNVDQSVVTKELDISRTTNDDGKKKGNSKSFNLHELLYATENFNMENLLGEGGFGKVFKGKLKETGEVLAIKQLDSDGSQGIREFVVEMMTLSLVDHPNLVKLVGYCVEAGQKLLVYEHMSLGSLEGHLHGANRKRLDWNIRMKIAAGAARGLEYLHDKMNPPIIYRDLKCSNLLLGEDYHPKLSDFGLAKVGPTGNNTHVSTRVMGTYGYCAPEYAMTGQLTFKSDIYSFGVFLLEIITGRRAIDNRKSAKEQNLVAWARPLLKNRENICHMADPALEGQYPEKSLYKALATALLCVQEQPSKRPRVSEVVKALDHIVSQPYIPESHPSQKIPEILVVI